MDDLFSERFQPRLQSRIFSFGEKCGFMKAISVYINKPHVVNRRLCGAKILHSENFEKFDEIIFQQIKVEWSTYSASNFERSCISLNVDLTQISSNDNSNHFHVVVRDLLPRQRDKFPTLRELIIFDYQRCSATFCPICYSTSDTQPQKLITDIENEVIYQFVYSTSKSEPSIVLNLSQDSEQGSQCHVTGQWLKDVLLPKLGSWSEERSLKTSATSLTLVPIDEYNSTYNRLKASYGQYFVKIWPESTDPQKFVFEDVAIAAYLLVLWKEEREKLKTENFQSFVDLGCGNGLLVHILASEGHPGLGIDLRRRKIWTLYGEQTKLEERSISPSADTLFPEYDWLIGNHSDELTPWIPLIAARSSYKCRYFVLPCCHHDFHGKFNKREQGTSQYRTYLNFVKEVGEKFGFKVREDILRIPSTKRVCFIGQEKTYQKENEESIDILRSEYVKSRCPKTVTCDISNTSKHQIETSKRPLTSEDKEESEKWSSSFQARSNVEPVRNCQRVAKETKDLIVQTVFKKVLEASDAETVVTESGASWNRGGSIALGSVAEMFDQKILQQLKFECGGLQTLLRNHNNIFQVSGGSVKLRDFSVDNPWSTKKRKPNKERTESAEKLKTVLCWFHTNHPDGCPRSCSKCRFAHGVADLRQRPKKTKS